MWELLKQKGLINKTNLGVISAGFSALFIASYAPLAKGLLETFSSHTLTAIGQVIAALILLFVFGLVSEYRKFHKLSQQEKIVLLIISLLTAVIGPLLRLKGLAETTATNTILIGQSQSMLMGILSIIYLSEKTSRNQIVGTLVMTVGVVCIVTEFFQVNFGANPGDIYVIFSSFTFAIANTIAKKYLHHVSPELIVLVRNTVGGILFAGLLPIFFRHLGHDLAVEYFSKQNLLLLFLFSVFAILLARLLWYNALEMIPMAKADSIIMTVPLFGVLLSVVFLGETLEVYHYLGGILILGGFGLTMHHQHKHCKHHKFLQKVRPFHH